MSGWFDDISFRERVALHIIRDEADAAGRWPWDWARLPGLSIRENDVGETKHYYTFWSRDGVKTGSGWSLVPFTAEEDPATPPWWLVSERRPEGPR